MPSASPTPTSLTPSRSSASRPSRSTGCSSRSRSATATPRSSRRSPDGSLGSTASSTSEDRAELEELAGKPLRDSTSELVAALDPDRQLQAAKEATASASRAASEIAAAATTADRRRRRAARNQSRAARAARRGPPLLRADARRVLARPGHRAPATRRTPPTAPGARSTRSEQFIDEHKDEITALQILYSRPYQQRLDVRRDQGAGEHDRPSAVPVDARAALGGL